MSLIYPVNLFQAHPSNTSDMWNPKSWATFFGTKFLHGENLLGCNYAQHTLILGTIFLPGICQNTWTDRSLWQVTLSWPNGQILLGHLRTPAICQDSWCVFLLLSAVSSIFQCNWNVNTDRATVTVYISVTKQEGDILCTISQTTMFSSPPLLDQDRIGNLCCLSQRRNELFAKHFFQVLDATNKGPISENELLWYFANRLWHTHISHTENENQQNGTQTAKAKRKSYLRGCICFASRMQLEIHVCFCHLVGCFLFPHSLLPCLDLLSAKNII